MIDIDTIIHQLSTNAEIVHALVLPITDEQAKWKPDPDTWSMQEVMDHVYNEERLDFRRHLKEMLADPPLPWGDFPHEDYLPIESCQQALMDFLKEREASIAWLRGLDAPDWEIRSHASFGPEGGELSLSAGDVLVSWVAHDFLHIRQMNELLYTWNAEQVSPYSVQYAGGW